MSLGKAEGQAETVARLHTMSSLKQREPLCHFGDLGLGYLSDILLGSKETEGPPHNGLRELSDVLHCTPSGALHEEPQQAGEGLPLFGSRA